MSHDHDSIVIKTSVGGSLIEAACACGIAQCWRVDAHPTLALITAWADQHQAAKSGLTTADIVAKLRNQPYLDFSGPSDGDIIAAATSRLEELQARIDNQQTKLPPNIQYSGAAPCMSIDPVYGLCALAVHSPTSWHINHQSQTWPPQPTNEQDPSQ